MRNRTTCALFTFIGLVVGVGCSAGNTDTTGSSSSTGGSSSSSNQGGSSSSQGGSTGTFTTGTGGVGDGGGGGIPVNNCGTECGPAEICDGIHKGLDDNCNGVIDENCLCSAGQASSCFKGDPSFADSPGCLPGTMYCTELGTWGECVGGKHAVAPDNCQLSDPLGCHPINGVPFQTVDLVSGTGNFSVGGSNESFTVTCPTGVSPCPTPTNNTYQPLQSGEYTVTYTRTVNGMVDSCTYPLYVGARGLRVELSWNYPAATCEDFLGIPLCDPSLDLDLHLHQPNTTTAWAPSGASQDCGFANCTASAFLPSQQPNAPSWFNGTAPNPTNWYDDTTTPNDAGNLCYFAPRGAGDDWAAGNKGCHNPRLDLDNTGCDPSVTDATNPAFCAPENINVDFPPKDQWFRVGVYFWDPGGYTGDVYPSLKIFCDGKLAGEVGASGFGTGMPATPMKLNSPADDDKWWLGADVMFTDDGCAKQCVVQTIYGDPANKTPKIQTGTAFGPAYPPSP